MMSVLVQTYSPVTPASDSNRGMTEKRPNADERLKDLMAVALRLEGLSRHAALLAP